jgi:hypothetical protein
VPPVLGVFLAHDQRQSLIELIDSYDEPIVMACRAATNLDAAATLQQTIPVLNKINALIVWTAPAVTAELISQKQ